MSRLKPAIRTCLAPRNTIRNKGVRFGNPETIRVNQKILVNQEIRANLRIDSRESGHLRLSFLSPVAGERFPILGVR